MNIHSLQRLELQPGKTAVKPPALHACLIVFILLGHGSLSAAPGDLDPSFGTGGKVTTSFTTTWDTSFFLEILPDGRILAGGWSNYTTGNPNHAFARYTDSGTLDPTFGQGGMMEASYGNYDDMRSIALQADGKILAAGSVGSYSGASVFRYTAEGQLDTSFGQQGTVSLPLVGSEDGATAVALQNDGKILVAINTVTTNQFWSAIARLDPDGSPDPTFNGSGFLLNPDPSAEFIRIVPDPSGNFLVGGKRLINGSSHLAVWKFSSAGLLVPDFNDDGRAIMRVGKGVARTRDMAVQSDGKIVLVGTANNGINQDFAMARFTANGSPDLSFGSGGSLLIPIGTGNAEAYGIVIQPDDRIVAVGRAKNGQYADYALVRCTKDGALDPTFGTAGIVLTAFGIRDDFGYGVKIQPDGKIVVTGSSNQNTTQVTTSYDFALARYEGGGALPADPVKIVEQPAGNVLTNGLSEVAFGPVLSGSNVLRTFVVRNSGAGPLTGLGMEFTGADPNDFSVSTLPVAPLVGGGSTAFTVSFSPTNAGAKSATLEMFSNDTSSPRFEVQLLGYSLAPDEDEDGDGVSNIAEMNLITLGFDPFLNSSAMRAQFHDNAQGLGLLGTEDIENLSQDAPLLQINPDTRTFALQLGMLTGC